MMSMLIERETSAGSEGARRATGDPAGRDAAGVPDPEVSEQAKRRRFTAEYKLRIVREPMPARVTVTLLLFCVERACTRRIYRVGAANVTRSPKRGWRPRKRGRKAKAEDPRVKELERENARLQRRLARVETMLEIQKKTSELLGVPLNPLDSYEND